MIYLLARNQPFIASDFLGKLFPVCSFFVCVLVICRRKRCGTTRIVWITPHLLHRVNRKIYDRYTLNLWSLTNRHPTEKKQISIIGGFASVGVFSASRQYTALRPSPNILIQFAYFANEAADIHFVRPVRQKKNIFRKNWMNDWKSCGKKYANFLVNW